MDKDSPMFEIMVRQCKSMVIELDTRLGDDNPWRGLDFDKYSYSDLAAIKKLMHELLYAPPG